MHVPVIFSSTAAIQTESTPSFLPHQGTLLYVKYHTVLMTYFKSFCSSWKVNR